VDISTNHILHPFPIQSIHVRSLSFLLSLFLGLFGSLEHNCDGLLVTLACFTLRLVILRHAFLGVAFDEWHA
jgi:hypothetical protein